MTNPPYIPAEAIETAARVLRPYSDERVEVPTRDLERAEAKLVIEAALPALHKAWEKEVAEELDAAHAAITREEDRADRAEAWLEQAKERLEPLVERLGQKMPGPLYDEFCAALTALGPEDAEEEPCKTCGGSGWVPVFHRSMPCPSCSESQEEK